MNHELLHQRILQNCAPVESWFRARNEGLAYPFYSSFDMRDAGFNNICQADREASVEVAKAFLDSHYTPNTRKILLLTEEHTNNAYYWDNVLSLQTILQEGGREVRLAIPRALPAPLQVPAASGKTATVYSAVREGTGIDIEGFKPDLIISNNDFSVDYEEWARNLTTPVNPPRELGWYRRRKDRFFRVYNELVGEFADLLKLDPWTLQVDTEVFQGFDVDDEDSRETLAAAAQKVYDRIKAKYAAHGITREPFLFVKNNAGTYGLGVMQVKTPEEIRTWNYKSRKKMKAAKGGREITEVIIQEGIPTTTQSEGGKTAEPVIYMIGCHLSGGFLRTHSEKSDEESLNSPGAVFQRLCIADLDFKIEGCPMENSYGWVARLAFLSVAREAKELGVEFKNYLPGGSCLD